MLIFLLYVILWPFLFVCLPTRIIGKRYVSCLRKKSAIISCNHQTYNDVILLKTRVGFGLKFLAKDSLFENKFCNWFFREAGAFPVKRGGNDIEAVKNTIRLLNNNKKIVIFPEGTRVKQGETVEYKNGLVMMAMKTDSYVVPTIFRRPTYAFRFNECLIGKPFKFSEIEEFKGVKITKEILNRASAILSEKMDYLKNVKIKEYKKKLKEDFVEFKNNLKMRTASKVKESAKI